MSVNVYKFFAAQVYTVKHAIITSVNVQDETFIFILLLNAMPGAAACTERKTEIVARYVFHYLSLSLSKFHGFTQSVHLNCAVILCEEN